jgi:phosphoribosylpyrophosphate synthetase
VPNLGYARLEQRGSPGDPRSAQLAGRLLGSVRLDQPVTLELHAPALTRALSLPTTPLHAEEVFLPSFKGWGLRSPIENTGART